MSQRAHAAFVPFCPELVPPPCGTGKLLIPLGLRAYFALSRGFSKKCNTCIVLKKVDTFWVVILDRVYTCVLSPETGFKQGFLSGWGVRHRLTKIGRLLSIDLSLGEVVFPEPP